jgi:DNA-binding MarR family transcriptional regulator
MSGDVLHYHLRDLGTVLANRRRGREAADRLRDLAQGGQDIVLDFEGVEAVTPPFVQELLDAMQAVLAGDRDSGRLAIVANPNEDVIETFSLVLERRKKTLAYRIGDRTELLYETAPHLLELLREAQKLRTFTASDLADRLDVRPNTVHQRLKPLLESGAIGRERDREAKRGVRHVYRAVGPDQPPPEAAADRESVPA